MHLCKSGNAAVAHGSELADWLSCSGSGKPRDSDLRHKAFDVYVIGAQETQTTSVDKLAKRVMEAFKELGIDNDIQLVSPKFLRHILTSTGPHTYNYNWGLVI